MLTPTSIALPRAFPTGVPTYDMTSSEMMIQSINVIPPAYINPNALTNVVVNNELPG